jgi:hypothetical protein
VFVLATFRPVPIGHILMPVVDGAVPEEFFTDEIIDS